MAVRIMPFYLQPPKDAATGQVIGGASGILGLIAAVIATALGYERVEAMGTFLLVFIIAVALCMAVWLLVSTRRQRRSPNGE